MEAILHGYIKAEEPRQVRLLELCHGGLLSCALSPTYLYAVLLVFTSLQVYAEDQLALLQDAEFFGEVPSIESVTRLPQIKSETPAGVTIIDSEMILASGARDLPELFRLVPGFQVANFQQDMQVVTYHGLGSPFTRRMLLLIDGRSAFGSFTDNINWYGVSLALEDIERIEVIRGPNTVTYGDNAFFATINVITRHASKIRDISLGMKAGEDGYGDLQIRKGLHFRQGDVRLSAGYSTQDDKQDRPIDFKKKYFNLRSDWTFGESDTLMLQIGANETSAAIGGDSSSTPLTERIKDANFQQLVWRRSLNDANDLHLQVYHNYDATNLDYEIGPFNAGPYGIITIPVTRDKIEERYDIELEQTMKPTSELRSVWGVGARRDAVKSEAFLNDSREFVSRSYRIFGNGEWHLTKDTVVNGGMLWEKSSVSGPSLSPRLAVNQYIDNGQTLRAAISRAKRQPSIGEEKGDQRITYQGFLVDQNYADWFDLENETVDSVEFGYLARIPAASLMFDARLYRDRIADMIVHRVVPAGDRDGEALALSNAGDIDVSGLEIEMTYQPTRDFRVKISNAWMRADAGNFNGKSVYTDKQYEESVPDYSGSLFMQKRLSADWNFSLVYSWVDEMLWLRQTTSSNHRLVDAYTQLDLRLGRTFRLGSVRGECALVLQNVGAEHQDYFRQNTVDMDGYFGVKIDF